MPRVKKIQSWRVEALDRKHMKWTQHCVHDAEPSARVCCGALLNHGHNARVRSFMKTILVADPVGAPTAAQRHRQATAAQMSDRADALKRYKSPG